MRANRALVAIVFVLLASSAQAQSQAPLASGLEKSFFDSCRSKMSERTRALGAEEAFTRICECSARKSAAQLTVRDQAQVLVSGMTEAMQRKMAGIMEACLTELGFKK